MRSDDRERDRNRNLKALLAKVTEGKRATIIQRPFYETLSTENEMEEDI